MSRSSPSFRAIHFPDIESETGSPVSPAQRSSAPAGSHGLVGRGRDGAALREERPALYDLASLYDLVVRPGPCEGFYRELARHAAGPVLELACGTGRLTLPLGREGHEVVALDAAPAMLDAARAKARRAKARGEDIDIVFVDGDMRRFDLGRRFALVIVSCNSLAHLTTNEDLRTCFSCIGRHLAPDGLLAFDIVNPDMQTLARPSSDSVRIDAGLNPSSAIAVEEQTAYDPVGQIRVLQWRVREPEIGVSELAPLRLRQIFPQELPLLLEAGGLELMARYGDFARNPLSAASLIQLCLVRRARRDSGASMPPGAI